MSNKHIKVINGKKYYYESIRVGKKVTSRYIGPVERLRKRKRTAAMPMEEQIEEIAETKEDSANSYIG